MHCSAGIGRTGTLIGIDIGMAALEDTHAADVVNIIDSMRVGRGGMVQTPEQYEFVHRSLEDFAILRNGQLGLQKISNNTGGNLYGNIEGDFNSVEL